jgi:hypothetical protein
VVDGLSCVELGVCLSCVLGVVAQPLRRADTLVFFFWFLCGPFTARGAKGEAEYLSRWLGGTGERFTVGKQERRGARATRSADDTRGGQKGNGMIQLVK